LGGVRIQELEPEAAVGVDRDAQREDAAACVDAFLRIRPTSRPKAFARGRLVG
jgi:hypothetical protein